jgi:interferon gamma-inducible protein 30
MAKIFSFIVLTSLVFMLISPFCSSADYHGIRLPSRPKSPKVNLSLYYETLCPVSKEFIVNDLVKVFKEDLISIVNLRLVPWGNAHIIDPNKTIICQVTF